MPVIGLTQARVHIKREVFDVDRKAMKAVTAALIVGSAYATMLTPVDTSFLVNSQFRKVEKGRNGFTGMVGYTAAYAAAVHESKGTGKGKPRPNGNGNYWDPTGEPQFLRKGFEDHLAEIDNAVTRVMLL